MTRTPPLLAALAIVALLGVGCSSGEVEPEATDAATETTADLQAQGVKFAACMRTNGVADFPDPDASGDFVYGISVTPEVWLAAVEACKELQPPGTLSAERTPEQQSAALTFAQCVRDNGVEDFPDPVEGEPLIDTEQIPSSNRPGGMAILDAAIDKCRERRSSAASNR